MCMPIDMWLIVTCMLLQSCADGARVALDHAVSYLCDCLNHPAVVLRAVVLPNTLDLFGGM